MRGMELKMKEKKLTVIVKILAILAICLISFFGIYVKENNQYKNKVKDYKLASDLTGYRQLVFEISDATIVNDSEGNKLGNTDMYSDEKISQNNYQKTEVKVNSDDDRNDESYQKVKSIIEKRLKGLGITNYNISVDNQNGKIFLDMIENDETDHAISNLLQVGKFQIRDSKDSEKVIINGNDLKKVSAVYNTTENGTTVYLQIELNKDATKKFADITENEYKTIENTTTENTTTQTDEVTTQVETSEENENTENTTTEENVAEAQEQKQVILAIDDNNMVTTSFDEAIKDGIIDLSMGASSKDADTVSNSLKTTSTIALILNSGEMPLTYKVTQNQYVNQNISNQCRKYALYGTIVLSAILIFAMIAKFKIRGLKGAISFGGFIALYLLIIRYTNVAISLGGIVAIIVISIISYLETINLLKINEADEEIKNKQITKEYISFILRIVPFFIVSIVFSFILWETIATFGMVAFWGIVLVLIYNYVVTRKLID